MSDKSNLTVAKKAKNDEFYTQLNDIENELRHYKSHLKGKKIFLNCDDYTKSNFYRYFELNFDLLEIESVTSTHYHDRESTYKLVIDRDEEGLKCIHEPKKLEQNGDFRSTESIEILKESDIVITNPPFSLFREYIAQLMEYEKKFIVIGSMPGSNYADVFPLIKDNKIWWGVTYVHNFKQPDETIKKFGNINWYTNLEHGKRNKSITLVKPYNESDYPKYDNYDIINIDKVVEIPIDYDGMMGVPITFLSKYNPEQFKILGNSNVTGQREHLMTNNDSPTNCTYISGKAQYARILIKRK